VPRFRTRKKEASLAGIRPLDQALRVLKKKMQKEGIFREMKRRRFYEKTSAKTTREKGEAISRARKLARKQAQREGLIAASAKKNPMPESRSDTVNCRHIVDDKTQGESCHGSASTSRDHTLPRHHAGCARAAKTGADRGHAR
jgi:small subunit ribosomal protein S21